MTSNCSFSNLSPASAFSACRPHQWEDTKGLTPSEHELKRLLGIGIEAAKADLGSKVKGLDWRLLLLVPVIIALCFFGFRWCGGLWVRSVLPEMKKPSGLHTAQAIGPIRAPAASNPPPNVSLTAIPIQPEHTNSIDLEVFMVGWALEGGKARVMLSDGRCVGLEDGLTQVTPSYCIVQGRIYRMLSPDQRLRAEEKRTGRRNFTAGRILSPEN